MIGFNFFKYSTTSNKSYGPAKNDEFDFLKYDIFFADVIKITSSKAFRRMQNKTSVVFNAMPIKNDHFRNRLTHSIEVANIARFMANRMRLCQELTESISLAHDIGHPPLGHRGEQILDEILQNFGTNFCHNEHGLRIVTGMYNEENLNLSFECLDGLLKHNFPAKKPSSGVFELMNLIFNNKFEIDIVPTMEAQVSGISDDIAYLTHDIEDALRFGMELDLFNQIPVIEDIIKESSHINLKDKLRDFLINNVILTTSSNIQEGKICPVEFDKSVKKEMKALKALMMEHFYLKNNNFCSQYEDKINKLFEKYMSSPEEIKNESMKNKVLNSQNEQEKACIVVDYIAGMTDVLIANI